MRSDELEEKIATRAVPLPEEEVAEDGREDHRAKVAGILRDSEDRVAAVDRAEAPADAADEHRHSEETTDA